MHIFNFSVAEPGDTDLYYGCCDCNDCCGINAVNLVGNKKEQDGEKIKKKFHFCSEEKVKQKYLRRVVAGCEFAHQSVAGSGC